MPNDVQDNIKNTLLTFGTLRGGTVNAPVQYKSKQRQYMSFATRKFANERAYLSSDYVNANVQGLTEKFYDFVNINLRIADVRSGGKLSFSGRKTDDFKEILIPSEKIDYIPIGAKINTMGSTWLVITPQNISSPNATAIVARCNASYNSYDYYGNVITEPIVVQSYEMSENDNTDSKNLVLINGTFKVTCQLNDNTKNLRINKRVILGDNPYYITGFTDFIEEFSGNRDSAHLLSFNVRLEEPTVLDDLENNYIANGKSFSFGAMIDGEEKIEKEKKKTFGALFIKNDEEIYPSSKHPLTWIWSSDDESTACVDENGNVTGIKEGNAVITATLLQNPGISADFKVTVTGGNIKPYISFDAYAKKAITQYTYAVFDAFYYENGEKTQKPVVWSFSGAPASSYAVEFTSDDMIVFSKISFDPDTGNITLTYDGDDEYIGSKLNIDNSSGKLTQIYDSENKTPTKLYIANRNELNLSPSFTSDDMILFSKVIFEPDTGTLILAYDGNGEYIGSKLDIDNLSGELIQIYHAENKNPAKLYIVNQNELKASTGGIRVYCIHPSKEPLVITASYGNYSKSITVELEGY